MRLYEKACREAKEAGEDAPTIEEFSKKRVNVSLAAFTDALLATNRAESRRQDQQRLVEQRRERELAALNEARANRTNK